jgi:DHA3 family macrolide efflux protein-like MFS transporter
MVNMVTGIAIMLGSILVTVIPPPKSRVRVILNSLLFSMSTENFILAFGRSTFIWCVGALLGWIFIPVMNANMDVLFRMRIPIELQGRVYSARNSLQFFTIPLGYVCGGFLIDRLCEPFMAAQPMDSLWTMLFGSGKGSGAALLFLAIGVFGALSCLPFRADKHIRHLEE